MSHNNIGQTPLEGTEAWIRKFSTILEVTKLNRNIPCLNGLEWDDLNDTYSSKVRSGDELLLIDITTDLVYSVVMNSKQANYNPRNLKLRTYDKEVWTNILVGSKVASTTRKSVPKPEPTLDQEARKVIYGDREQAYGHPSRNLQLIADFWSSYLGIEIPLTCDDVCNMMILMKTARLKNMPDHRDSLVDTIGYTLLKERCREVENLDKPSKSFTDPKELIKELNK